MSFGRFLWLLQNRSLWLSRADLLGDPWEITLAGDQLERVISFHPITPLSEAAGPHESARQRSERIIRMWREQTFVSCWSASEHESHALWRVYCSSVEGVAIRTTLGRLRTSAGNLPLLRVTYDIPGTSRRTPTRSDLVTKKRPMFAYENEVRIVSFAEPGHPTPGARGYRLDWNPADWVEAICVHPEADDSFLEAVVAAVETYARTLTQRVTKSAMAIPPPF